ncbi:diaminopropionate ammonia-lyase [Fusarium pseudocircinatum]|uniref:Diaminopropionate ammonia-lyase n=1 Tax=Fusarium pseudocircinatum TaxID=56676 RepID=A0A8H5KMF9_9HYPO|nr:diaminopropionate ammonia-lyase [Fusarium pseudocircinatum]
MPVSRRPMHLNPNASQWTAPPVSGTHLVEQFHKQLPGYRPTELTYLDDVTKELGLGAVYVKSEVNRFNLPSFKILGASWGCFRALTKELNLPAETDLESLKLSVRHSDRCFTLFAATDGNHGRATAWFAGLLGIKTEIYVPDIMHKTTIRLIESEGAKVTLCKGGYDESVLAAYNASRDRTGGILIQDMAFEDYQEIPQWIVEGYTTLMREAEQQLPRSADLVITPVGVGSLAQAVVSHSKREGSSTAVMAVEPDGAACLYKSLVKNKLVSLETTLTIMAGLECGTPSASAWPLLQAGVDASLTVSDFESHEAAMSLQKAGIPAGPCGSAGLAALRRLTLGDKAKLGLGSDSIVVLLCTEGSRDYETPRSVWVHDPSELVRVLDQIRSTGWGEISAVRYIVAWLEHHGVETYLVREGDNVPLIAAMVQGEGDSGLVLDQRTVTVASVDNGESIDGTAMCGELGRIRVTGTSSDLANAMLALASRVSDPKSQL